MCNLSEIARRGMPVPPGFALAVDAYNAFMAETNAEEEISQYLAKFFNSLQSVADFQKASKDIRQIADSKRMPKAIEQAVLLSYDALCQKCNAANVAVSVRSAGPKSHPGQYETYLNVRGKEALLKQELINGLHLVIRF
jgi:pyruvate,water dikinase